MKRPPIPPQAAVNSRRSSRFTPLLLGFLAFFTTTSILMSDYRLETALTFLPLWAIGFIGVRYGDHLRTAVQYFKEYHAYLRAMDRGLLPAPVTDSLSAKARDSVDLSGHERAEFKRLMTDAGIKE